MRQKNPKYMKEIEDFVDEYYTQYHKTPSCREIAENTTLQRSAVQRYLTAMNEQGMIQYDGKSISTRKIRNSMTDRASVGIVGSIQCGPLTDEEEALEGYVDLPTSLFGNGEFYLLHAYRDSMINAGIDDGDMVLVRRQEEARDGDIVVAYVEGEGNTLKRFYHAEDGIILHPENETMDDIKVDHCEIQGVAVWVFKKIAR